MFSSYGEVILQKNSILYHTSDDIFTIKPENDYPILFCVFHPYEWYKSNKYVTFIKLKRDISLFFMLDFKDIDTKCNKPERVLEKFIGKNLNYTNIEKNKDVLDFFSVKMKENKFDGWISSQKIEKSYLEIGLINNSNIFDVKTKKLKPDWSNFCYNPDNSIKLKNWGSRYIIEKLIIFKINKRYKKSIKKYMNKCIKDNFRQPMCLHMLLNNAEIIYHDYTDLCECENKDIIWNLPDDINLHYDYADILRNK